MVTWESIVTEHGPLVWRLVNRLLGNEHDPADCYQTVFVEAFEASQRRRIDNWAGFLTRVSTRRSIDLLRLRYRDRPLSREAVNQLAQAPAADSPHRVAEDRELIAQLQEALTRLPADQVEVFCLRYFEQMPNQDIAVQLATSANRVGVLLHRAREALREALKWLPALGGERAKG